MKRASAVLVLCASCTVRGVVGTVAEDGDVVTELPRLPTIEVASSVVRGSSVEVSLAPIEGAKDYRIYVLPRDEDIVVEPDGYVTVRRAVYRCAGDREAPLIPTDGQMQVQSGAIESSIVGDVAGFMRRAEDATLGFVYTRAGAGRVPVYALADPNVTADNTCYFHRYATSRIRRYTKSDDERSALLALGFRDDGIAFYVPDAPSFDTRTIHGVRVLDSHLVVPDGVERDAVVASSPVPLFDVQTARAPETEPLMRVHYTNACGDDHDVLVVGAARFAQALQQGRYALPYLHYAGLTEPTTLVVEALDVGCPFRGHLSPEHRDAYPGENNEPMRQAWLTFDELTGATPSEEVFVNGQHAATNRPRAIARAFVHVRPSQESGHDFHESFDTPIAQPTHTTYSSSMGGPFVDHVYDFPTFDARLYSISGEAHAIGTLLGELVVSHGDAGAQTQSKLRITPRASAMLSETSFLHARMDVDIVTTSRRFPQILISDQRIPVQESPSGYAIVTQVQGEWPASMQIAFCDGVLWDATNNCPFRDLSFRPDGSWSPTPPVGELAGVDRVSRLEVYASTRRVYALLDGIPYGCVDLPPNRIAEGTVTVTFGDVLFHSGIDVEGEVLGEHVYAFHREHMHVETRRHFDDLAFTSGVAAPAWDETRLPCFTSP